MAKSIYGYFDAPGQTEPVYDPGLEAPCPVCHKRIGEFTPDNPNIKTISIMLEFDPELGHFRGDRSYFYRVHKACYDNLSDEQQAMLDWPIIDPVAQARESN